MEHEANFREENLASNIFKRIKCNFTNQAMLLAYITEKIAEKKLELILQRN